MSTYTLSTTVPGPFETVVERVRAGLAEVGFGVISEIDMASTLKAKLGVDVPPQLILGACRPTLAHQAIQADPSVAALLPCNVVVRAVDEGRTLVESLDPSVMATLAGDALRGVADDASERLHALRASLIEEI